MKTKKMKKKTVALLSALLIMAVATAGITLAMLVDKTGKVENAFTPSEVTCDVVEDFDRETKSNVKIANTGDTDAFIRATVVVTWQKYDVGGNQLIAPEVPKEGTDYEIVWNNGDHWLKIGNYYYFKNRVSAADDESDNDLTTVLVESIEVKTQHPEGYRLSVEIIADAIQADGFKAGAAETADQPAEIAWGVLVNNVNGKAVSISAQ